MFAPTSASWLESFSQTHTYDLFTILLGLSLLFSFILYKIKSASGIYSPVYRYTTLAMTFVYILWISIGLYY